MRLFWVVVCCLIVGNEGFAQLQRDNDLTLKAKTVMLEATRYMVETVSTNGGYVRLYREDFSRRWAELEAYNTQIAVQDPGTVAMGNLFLDAYDITNEHYYYQAAVKAANALIYGQHQAGGWHYIIDFAGDHSLRNWHATIGKNAWGFEEHYHYYGNATFDDLTTARAAKFLLRIYRLKHDAMFKPALDKAIAFVLASQYPQGGWPQRYPLMYNHPVGTNKDYTHYYTFNDDVIWGNIDFLIQCYEELGEQRLLEPIYRGMNFYLVSQQGNPQAGWAQQYDMKLRPAPGRTYEPASISTLQTYDHVLLLLQFYRYTGAHKYLARIPDAIRWLEMTQLPDSLRENGVRTHPFFVELETNAPLWIHRGGTGVHDGKITIDHNMVDLYGYHDQLKLDLAELRRQYDNVQLLSLDEITAYSPIIPGIKGKDYVPHRLRGKITSEDSANMGERKMSKVEPVEVNRIIDGLDDQYRWLSKHEVVSTPYSVSASGIGANTAMHSEEMTAKRIPDPSDQQYVAIRTYMRNMNVLMDYLYAIGK